MGLVDAIRRLTNTPAFKFLLVIDMILALAIPLIFVYLLVCERARYASSAQAEIGQAWGGAQTLRGPFVLVPTKRAHRGAPPRHLRRPHLPQRNHHNRPLHRA
jgi:inner membrane protein involved in colicin E2 resistance